jgi:DNA-binding transcriptional LysR family regulator
MDLKQLRYFLAVAEEAHFGRAARRLHIVQPALSMQIRALEESLGTRLFKRTSRRVELTEAGALLRVEAERTIAQAEHAKSVVQRAARGEIGTIRIGFAGYAAFAGAGVLSRHIRTFHARHPNVQMTVREIGATSQVEEIVTGGLDIGYNAAFGDTFDRRLAVDLVGSWPWVIAICREHPLAGNETLSAKSLRDEPFIVYGAHSGDDGNLTVIRRMLGREPQVTLRSSSALTSLTMVAGGLALALLPEPLSQIRIPGLTFRPVADFVQPSRLVLLSRADDTSGPVNTYLKLVRAQSAQLQQGR